MKVDKQVFPSLLGRLWEESFQAEHLKAGFRRAGLCPLSKDAIPKSCYGPSLPQVPLTPIAQDTECDSTDHTVHVAKKAEGKTCRR